MKQVKEHIQIATIGQLGNTVVMNVYLERIDIQDDGDSVIWYKEPKGRKVKGQYLNDTLIALRGWDNFTRYTTKVQCGEFSTVQEHWDGTIQLATTTVNTPTNLWTKIYQENLNPNFKRYDLLKINNTVLFTLKSVLEDKDKIESLSNIFSILDDGNHEEDSTELKDIEDRWSIVAVGRKGVTWYLTEWDQTNHTFFGYASLFHDHNDEWGDIPESDLLEMDAVIVPHSQNYMRDQHYFRMNLTKKLN